MLFMCPIIEDVWVQVVQWLKEIGYDNYNLSVEPIILEDLDNSPMFSVLILASKKGIYNAIRTTRTYKEHVLGEMKSISCTIYV